MRVLHLRRRAVGVASRHGPGRADGSVRDGRVTRCKRSAFAGSSSPGKAVDQQVMRADCNRRLPCTINRWRVGARRPAPGRPALRAVLGAVRQLAALRRPIRRPESRDAARLLRGKAHRRERLGYAGRRGGTSHDRCGACRCGGIMYNPHYLEVLGSTRKRDRRRRLPHAHQARVSA